MEEKMELNLENTVPGQVPEAPPENAKSEQGGS
jgi:hypothetical protein